MAQGDINEISHSIGELSGKLDSLMTQFRDNEGAARDRWAKVYERLDKQDALLGDTRYSLETLQSHVEDLKGTIENDIKPVTDDVRRYRAMGLGALGIIGIGGSAFGAGVLWLLSQLGWVKV